MEKVIAISGLRPDLIESKILVYPTDTLYGIGCNAQREDLVLNIFKIKKRLLTKPLSIVAPSIEWIYKNCKVNKSQKKLIEKYLPGPYTLIFEKKEKTFLSLATASGDTIAVRFLDTKIQELIAKANIPFVTTSANISGDKRILKRPNSLKKEIKENIDYIVIENQEKMTFIPSTIIDVRKEKERLLERK